MISFHLQWWPLSTPNFDPILISKLKTPLTIQNQIEIISDDFKQNVYNQCRSFSQQSLGPLQRYGSNGELIFPNQKTTLQDVYLLLWYSPRRDDEYGLYLQLATSYLISQNLQQLSIQQQTRTRVLVFLNENYTNVMYNRLEIWFKSIYAPYTVITHIIRTEGTDQVSREFMMNYTKYYTEVQFDTVLFLLEDDYIFDIDMLSDTIEFFASHNPCFVHQTDYSTINDVDDSITLVPGRTRLWRSISSITGTYACRWRTFLALEDIIIHSKNKWESSRNIRDRVGNTAFFCAIPLHGARIEKLLLPNEVNITTVIDTAVYYKDWWSLARRALSEGQKKDAFPAPQVNELNLFTHVFDDNVQR